MHPATGWCLEGTQDGLRVFTRQLDSLQQYSNTQVLASSLIVDTSPKVCGFVGVVCVCDGLCVMQHALSLVASVKELPCWFFGLPSSNCSSPSLVKSLSSTSHVIQFTMAARQPQGLKGMMVSKLRGWTMKYAPFVESLVTAPSKIKTETVER